MIFVLFDNYKMPEGVGGGGGNHIWHIVHLLCGDMVPKYRAENGAGEEGTLRTINIHTPWMENAPVQGEFSSSPN